MLINSAYSPGEFGPVATADMDDWRKTMDINLMGTMNLSQAVMLMCYELLRAGENENPKPMPRLATRHELDGMYAALKDILVRIDYIGPDNPDYWMNKIRRFGNRIQLRAREVSVIRGICRQINWYGKKCYQDGQKPAVNPEK